MTQNIDENDSFLIEVALPGEDETLGEETLLEGLKEKLTRIKKKDFSTEINMISYIANKLHKQLQKIESPPTEAFLELGFSFNTDTKLYLVGLSSSATLKVQLTWDTAKSTQSHHLPISTLNRDEKGEKNI